MSYYLPFSLKLSIFEIAGKAARALSVVTLAYLLAMPAIANADYASLQEAVADTTVSDKTYNLGADENGGKIDMANSHIDTNNFGSVTLNSNIALAIDAALATTEAYYISAQSISANGNYFVINTIKVLGNADTSTPISKAIQMFV